MMHDEMKPKMPVDDSEARMARSELYRAAKYSMKLFEMIHEGQELEGWVSAKITKSADYLDSVYHYMEYQVKFGQGGTATSLDDITSDAAVVVKGEVSEEDDEQNMKESYQQKLQALLEGAMKKAKGKKAEDKKEEKMDEASGVRATDKKKGKVEKSERKIYFVKLEKDNKVKGVTTQADEGESQGEVRDRVKRENMGWTVVSIREKASVDESKEEDAKKADAKKAEEEKRKKEEKKKKISKIVDEAKSAAQKAAQEKFKAMAAKKKGGGDDKGSTAKKGSKPDFLDLDKDGNKKEPMKSAAKNESRVDELSPATLQSFRQKRQAQAQHAYDISKGTSASQYQDAQRGEAPTSDAEKASAAALAKKRQAGADIAGYKLGKLSTNDPDKKREYAISKKVQAKQDAEWAAKQGKLNASVERNSSNMVAESTELSDILKLAGRKPING